MKIEKIDIAETIKITQELIEVETDLSVDLKNALDQLFHVTKLMIDHFTLKSNIPPASDLNRKKNNDESSNNKSSGQPGHPRKTLII